MNKICYGCGIKLQSDDPDKEGYIPKEKKDSPYCMRCYKLMHYGKDISTLIPKTDYTIDKTNNNDDFVIFLVDFLSINNEVINLFNSIKKEKIFLISKYDLIKQYIKESSIKEFLIDNYNIKSDILFISSKTNYKVKELMNYLTKKNIKTSFIVGHTNSGKSTLINKLIDLNKSHVNRLTTSQRPNTTMDFIRVKINKDLTLIDTPGFVTGKDINITNKLKPITYQMKEEETLQVDDIYLKFDKDTSITLYISENIRTGKYYKEINFNNELKIDKDTDLIIDGLGFLNIKNECKIKTLNLRIHETRKSIFGAKNE